MANTRAMAGCDVEVAWSCWRASRYPRRQMEHAHFYGIEDQGWFLAFHCFTRYVKVDLPQRRLAASGSAGGVQFRRTCAISTYTQDDELDEDRLVSWLKQASALRGEEVF